MNRKQQIKEKPDQKAKFAFGKENYRIMYIGLALIAFGLLLMIGGGSDDPEVFNDAMFNTRRLTIAPILILGGFITQIVAIMHKPKE